MYAATFGYWHSGRVLTAAVGSMDKVAASSTSGALPFSTQSTNREYEREQ